MFEAADHEMVNVHLGPPVSVVGYGSRLARGKPITVGALATPKPLDGERIAQKVTQARRHVRAAGRQLETCSDIGTKSPVCPWTRRMCRLRRVPEARLIPTLSLLYWIQIPMRRSLESR